MALVKRVYKDEETLITAGNLNDIQDAIIELENKKAELDAAIANYFSKSSNIFASVVRGKLSGEIISARDVSPIEHTLVVKAHSKNLFDNTDDFVKTSATQYSFADGTLNVSGGYVNKWIKVEEGKTYTFSTISERVGNTGGGIYIRMYTEDKVNYKLAMYDIVNLSPICTFTAEKGYPYIRFTFYGSTQSNTEESAVYRNIQLEEGMVATEFKAYTNPAKVNVFRYGKNLIQYPFSFATRTINGVTFTPQNDGSVIVNGTATANTYFALNGGFSGDAVHIPSALRAGKEYTVTDAMVFLYSAGGETMAFNAGTFTMPTGYDYYGIFLYVPANTTISTILRPQLELGDSKTEFEAYTREIYTTLADGTVEGVVSLAPSMTLVTDNEGVILDAEYNCDTKRYIDNNAGGAASARLGSTTIKASAWKTEADGLHSQVVTIAGVTPYSKVDLLPSVEQLAIFHNKDVAFVTENEDGVVTVFAIGDKPTQDYTMQVQITEVEV